MPPLKIEHANGIAKLTLHRPEARNALNTELLTALAAGMLDADQDPEVHVIILTGTDPAFCAGLDLRELAHTGGNLDVDDPNSPFTIIRRLSTPLLGAINGPAITGGLELALWCDFLIASERAMFGDTHAAVGVMPGGGITVLLPQAIGLRRAKEMSLTGNFIDAAEAHRLGLVNHVVAHGVLAAASDEIAAAIVAGDPTVVRNLRRTYTAASQLTGAEGLALELREFHAFSADLSAVAKRREDVIRRGRDQR